MAVKFISNEGSIAALGTHIWFRNKMQAEGRKTRTYDVVAKQEGTFLGRIRWHSSWCKYVFEPIQGTIYEETCLRDIAEFCETKTKEYKQAKKTRREVRIMGLKIDEGEQESKYDLVIKITYNYDDPSKTAIKTNVKKELVVDMLEEWLRGQIGQGEDKNPANKKAEYQIDIWIDLSYDRFSVKSDTGNKGLTCGIVMSLLNQLDKIAILDLDGK